VIVSGLQGCHHTHNNNKLGPLSNNNNNNNNNIRNNLNNLGRRRRRQTFNNVLGGNSNLANTGLRSPGVTNANPALNNNRPGAEQNSPLQPWSKLYWPRWFDCHRHRATGRLAFQVCRKQWAQNGYFGGLALTWSETRACIEDYAYIDSGYGDPDETSFNSWDLDRNGQVTYEEWWRVEGAFHQQMC